jgi:hypothetical protein
MSAPPLTAIFDSWNRPSYEVRVRATTPPAPPIFIWGSAGVAKDLHFDKPLILHVRNDVFGEQVTIAAQTAAGAQPPLATLQPGECVSIPLQDIIGIFATCTLESVVACQVHVPG